MEIFTDASLRRGIRIAGLSAMLGTLAACGGGGGGSSTPPPPQEGSTVDTGSATGLSLFALGEEPASSSQLVIYTGGINNSDGTALTADDYKNATVTVNGNPLAPTDVGTPSAVAGSGAPFSSASDLSSVAILSDYSHSMMQASVDSNPPDHLKTIGGVYQNLLGSLPDGHTAQVLDFSEKVRLRTDYTADSTQVNNATSFIPDSTGNDAQFSRSTALFDAINTAIGGGDVYSGGSGQQIANRSTVQGLDDQCTPIRMLVVLADGENNIPYKGMSNDQAKTQLKTEIADRAIFPVMLASRLEPGNTTGVDTVRQQVLENWGGYFAYQQGTDKLGQAVSKLQDSLQNMVMLRLNGSFNAGDTVQIKLPAENGHDAATATLKVRDFSRCP